MENFIKLSIFFSIFLFFTNCGGKYTTIEKNDFSIDLPYDLVDNTGNIFDGAVLEYQDSISDYYVVVLEENKTTFENNYTINDYQEDNIKYILESGNLSFETSETEINDLKVIITDATTKDENEKSDDGITTWKIALYETDSVFYTVFTWTGPEYIDNNLKKMKKIINSFEVK